MDEFIPSNFSASVIIPVGSKDKHIEYCLEAIYRSSKIPLQVIIVLDGWQREFKDPPKKWNLIVHSAKKSGPATCRNIGAQYSTAQFICFIDSDVEIHENIIESGIDFILSQNITGVIGSYDDCPHAKGVITEFRNLLHHYHHQKNDKQKGVFWGAFTIVDRLKFNNIGGFNEKYSKPSIEDIELGYRFYFEGHDIQINQNLQLKHRKRWTFKTMVYTDIYLRAKPWTSLLNQKRNWSKSGLNTNKKEKLSAFFSMALFISVGLSFYYTYSIFIALICLLIIVHLQQSLYSFFKKKFPFYKLPLIIALHQVYYLSAIAGFTLGTLSKDTIKKEKPLG